MELQSTCLWKLSPNTRFSCNPISSHRVVSSSNERWGVRRVGYLSASRVHWTCGFKRILKELVMASSNRVSVCASNSNRDVKLKPTGRDVPSIPVGKFDRVEPFRGKSGSVSFNGLTHQEVEASRLESAPFKKGTGSLLWALAPIALMSSFVLPPLFFASSIDAAFKDNIVAELVSSFTSELIFYIGLAVFLLVTDRVQKPYLQFSAKRWGLITGLQGYLSSAFFTMGIKIFAPLLVLFVTWPVLGLPALVAVAPFLVGCAAQFAFEKSLEDRDSSCWPLVPIIFEVYRLYQLTKAVHFIERLLFFMKEAPETTEVLDRSGALVSMVVTFQVLGLVCLWSLITFLMRLFPSRPVAENY